jgi:hypothetical protein
MELGGGRLLLQSAGREHTSSTLQYPTHVEIANSIAVHDAGAIEITLLNPLASLRNRSVAPRCGLAPAP